MQVAVLKRARMLGKGHRARHLPKHRGTLYPAAQRQALQLLARVVHHNDAVQLRRWQDARPRILTARRLLGFERVPRAQKRRGVRATHDMRTLKLYKVARTWMRRVRQGMDHSYLAVDTVGGRQGDAGMLCAHVQGYHFEDGAGGRAPIHFRVARFTDLFIRRSQIR